MPRLITGQVARFTFTALHDTGLGLRGVYELPASRTELSPVESIVTFTVANETDVFASDLVRVALALHTADCAVRRPKGSKTNPYGWSRRIAVRIPVRAVSVWMSAMSELIELLLWLTDDDWEVEFEPYVGGGPVKQMQFHPENDSVGLFSGGLDSMAGFALDRVLGQSAPIPFGISANTRTSGLQTSAINQFRKLVGPATLGFEHAFIRLPVRKENSQRTRGFLYLALASAVASVYRVGSVKVYENGVGAINLPLLPSQVGTMSSRSVHPHTLLLFQKLAKKVMGSEISYQLPHLFETKGQMYERLVSIGLGDLAKVTKSCDLIPRRLEPCRMCTSCLLSRMAMGDTQTEGEVQSLRGEHAVARWAMNTHALQISQALKSNDPWVALATGFPALWTALESSMLLTGESADVVERRILGMYSAFVQEWGRFVGSPEADK